jgi:hypothetical protein
MRLTVVEVISVLLIVIISILTVNKIIESKRPGLVPAAAENPAPAPAPKPRPQTPAPNPNAWMSADNTSDAASMIPDFITPRLVAPLTAKFPGTYHISKQTQKNGPQRYRIRSYVDSQNRFGAMVRTHYIAELEQTGPRHWKMTSFQELQ